MTGDELRARYDKSRTIQTYINGEEVAELAAALDDRDRLEWLQSSGMTQLTHGWESCEAAHENRKPVWIVGKLGDDNCFKGWAETIRAAIDAARGKS